MIKGPDGTELKRMSKDMDMRRAIQIWQGRPKIGKTSTANALGMVSEKHDLGFAPFFMLFEPGSGGCEVRGTYEDCRVCKGTGKQGKKTCPECHGSGIIRHILQDVDDITKWFEWAAKQDSLNPIVLDTGDAMFQIVSDDVCIKQGIPSPHQAGDHGAAWSMIYDEMRQLLGILTGAGKGLIIIMHVTMQERRVSGGTIQTAVFNVAGKTRQYFNSMANQILHFDIVPDPDSKEGKDKHVLFAQPTSGIEAGDHWGLFPPQLDLGSSSEEGAEAILEVFGFIERK